MDDITFQGFYQRTSAMLSAYLARSLRDRSAVDDILQESYFRLLRAHVAFEGEEHRRRYLFRIATNLVHDRRRAGRHETPLEERGPRQPVATGDLSRQTQERTDLQRAMARLTPRERDLVWLAYGQGSTHHEIAGALGLRTGSIKPMLFRARRKLAHSLLR